jgi:uncharacterized protein (DUF4415 family)
VYDIVMTGKSKKTKDKKTKSKKAKPRKAQARPRPKPATIAWLHASVEDDLLSLAGEETGAESRWSRPRKRRVSLRVDVEVVEWLKSNGPGYQTRINRILRRVMMESRNRGGEKSRY